ncbi:hypothetical protein BGZ51_006800 [Haplosporangium sp. Z 767]|nr:hypothetical protein BGZ51_006800 [Haplosporangium sp. Z 767]
MFLSISLCIVAAMSDELSVLQHQHQLERQNQTLEQRQEQEQLLQRQHGQLQEQQIAFLRLQSEHQQDPTPMREHELLMMQQAGHHCEVLFMQQQQHLLERNQQEQLRLQERQWHQEQLLLQKLHLQSQQQQQQQQQQLHRQHHKQDQQHHQRHQHHQHHEHQKQQPPTPFTVSSQTPCPKDQPQPQQHQHQHQHPRQQGHQQGQHQQQPQNDNSYFGQNRQCHSGFQNMHENQGHQQQQFQPSSSTSPPQQQQQQQQSSDEYGDSCEAMDVDDESQLLSITSTITHLRQHALPADIKTIGQWAAGPAIGHQAGEDDPEAVVVLDTNVLISHLNFLQTLIDTCGTVSSSKDNQHTNGARQPRVFFVVPWVVIQELDNLKGGRRSGGGNEVDLEGKARRAIVYIQGELGKSEAKRKLRGQKISECIEKAQKNDDQILDCCRYFRTLYPDTKTTKISLFSNDKNLCVKALIHEIKTISRGKVSFDLKCVRTAILGEEPTETKALSQSQNEITPQEDSMLLDDDNSMGSGGESPESNSSHRVSVVSTMVKGRYRTVANDRELERIKQNLITNAPDGMDPNLFELTNHVVKNLRRFLEVAVPEHLKSCYGNSWVSKTGFKSSPVKGEDHERDCRRLVQPIQLLQQHWHSVFASLYGNHKLAQKARLHLDNLQAFTKGWDRVQTFGLGKVYKKDLTAFLEDVDVILMGVLAKPAEPLDSSSLMEVSTPDTNKFFDPSTRIQLLKDWKRHCQALRD